MRRLNPALVAAVLMSLAPLALAQKGKAAPITVTEKGTGSYTPRKIRSNGSFSGRAATAAQALSEASTKAQSAKTGLLGLGLAAKQIRLEQPYVRQDYDNQGRPQQSFTASQLVTVKVPVKKMELALQANDVLAGAGGAVSGGPEYSDRAYDGAERRAKANAVKNARVQAEREAGKLGLTLGRVLAIGEVQSSFGGGGGFRSLAMAESARGGGSRPSTPTQFDAPERQTVEAYRTVTFEVK